MPLRDLIPRKAGPEAGHPLLSLRHEMDRLFEDFFHGWDLAPFAGARGMEVPKIDLAETNKEVKVSADLPGTDPKDVDISVSGNVLTIKGERKEEKEEKEKDYHRTERWTGTFQRSVTLPCDVDIDKTDATFKKGVLTITMPKAKTAKRKAIEVKVE